MRNNLTKGCGCTRPMRTKIYTDYFNDFLNKINDQEKEWIKKMIGTPIITTNWRLG